MTIEIDVAKMKFIKCHKCGHVHSTTGFYGKAVGRKCGVDQGVDIRKGAGGFTKCRATLRAENVFEAASLKEAKAI